MGLVCANCYLKIDKTGKADAVMGLGISEKTRRKFLTRIQQSVHLTG